MANYVDENRAQRQRAVGRMTEATRFFFNNHYVLYSAENHPNLRSNTIIDLRYSSNTPWPFIWDPLDYRNDGDSGWWGYLAINCLVNDDFRLIFMIRQSKWDNFSSRAPIPMGSLDPQSSCSDIRGNARFMSTFILVAFTVDFIPRLIQHNTKTPHNTY